MFRHLRLLTVSNVGYDRVRLPLLSVDELLVNRHGFPIRYLFFGNVGKSAAVGSGLSSGGGDVSGGAMISV